MKLFQFLHAVELEMAWIKEHKLQAASTDFGNSYEAVQNLQKKHNVSVNELCNNYIHSIQYVYLLEHKLCKLGLEHFSYGF